MTPGRHATVPDAYSLGALGWTRRYTRVVRIASRAELRLELDDRLVALIGQQVGGSALNLGTTTTLETLLGKTDPDEIEADIQEQSE